MDFSFFTLRFWSCCSVQPTHRPQPASSCSVQTWGDRHRPYLCYVGVEIKTWSRRRATGVPYWGIQVGYKYPEFQDTPVIIWNDWPRVFLLFCLCSYTLGSRWVTLAEHIKNQSFVVKNLKPATVYLFMVRAVNAYGLSDPSPISDSVRTQG